MSPSFDTLIELAQRLDITLGELFGDHAILRAAKATLLTPKVCQQFLDQLRDTGTDRILSRLAESLLPTRSHPVDYLATESYSI